MGKWSHEEKSTRYSPEVMERAVRLVFESREQYESQWAAIESIAGRIGCAAEALRHWVRQQERDTGQRSGPTTAEQERGQALDLEVKELRRANEILRLPNAYFALVQRQLGVLRNGSPFADMPAPLQLQQALLRREGDDRVMAQALAAVPVA